MVLAFNARISTKDVEAIFFPSSSIRSAAKQVVIELNLPEDWINDAVKGLLPGNSKEKKVLLALDNLAVWVPEPEYLLAMKSMSARLDTHDGADLRTLIQVLALKSSKQVFKYIEAYYPKKEIPVKTQYFVEEIFGE